MTTPWITARAIEPREFADIRRRTIFECCKWDPQVEDVATLCDVPLVLRAKAWDELAALAEALDREALATEDELLRRPELHRELSLPRTIRKALRRIEAGGQAARTVRCSRYDLHVTTEGWRLSEVNSDVPGGFIESSGFTSLVAAACEGFRVTGDPAGALAEAIRRATGHGSLVGFVHATAYTDDRQVMVYLARRLAESGLEGVLTAPDRLSWRDGAARLDGRPLAAIIRFFPGEWLVNLPRRCAWPNLVRSAGCVLCNPATALLTQSKRFPLVWDRLHVKLPTWQALLPETRGLTRRDRRPDDRWVYKPALGRVGDGVGISGVTSDRDWPRIVRSMRRHGRHWIAQRRFEAVALATPRGPMYPSLGVFVIDGRASGIYGRAAQRPLIDFKAMDVAVLIEPAAAPIRAGERCLHEPAGVV